MERENCGYFEVEVFLQKLVGSHFNRCLHFEIFKRINLPVLKGKKIMRGKRPMRDPGDLLEVK